MNYQKHYDLLIERAKNRKKLEGYIEKHHVLPRCLGGSDKKSNLVELTPEEHYVAHQMLVKIHPDHSGLVWAALLMTGHHTKNRSNNKSYGWLRRKQSKILKKARIGKGNGSYGTMWITNGVENRKVEKGSSIPDGFWKGRKIKEPKPFTKCIVCDTITGSVKAKYCDGCRNLDKKFLLENKDIVTKLYIDLKSIPRVLKELDIKGSRNNENTVSLILKDSSINIPKRGIHSECRP